VLQDTLRSFPRIGGVERGVAVQDNIADANCKRIRPAVRAKGTITHELVVNGIRRPLVGVACKCRRCRCAKRCGRELELGTLINTLGDRPTTCVFKCPQCERHAQYYAKGWRIAAVVGRLAVGVAAFSLDLASLRTKEAAFTS
jgi:hypothetical protein